MNSISSRIEHIHRLIPKAVKAAFFSAIIIALIAHATLLTNHFFNHDSLLSGVIGSFIAGLKQGRWFSVVVGYMLRGELYSSASVMIFGISFLVLTATITVAVLNIKSKVWAVCIAGFLVLFPSVMCTNAYLSSDVFFFSLLLATISVLLTVRYKRGFWFGILFLTLACGTYTVFIGYAAGLFVILILNDLLDGRKSTKEILITGIKYFSVLVVSALLYYIILKILLSIYNVSLISYRNIDKVGQFTATSLLKAIYESYRKVYYFFYYGIHLYRTSFSIEPMFRVMNWATIVLSVLISMAIGIRNGAFKSIPRIIFTIFMIGLFPLAIHAIGVLGQNANTHWIMIYPFVLVYVYMISCVDRMEQQFIQPYEVVNLRKIVKTSALYATIAVLIVSSLLIRQWFLTTNRCYEFLRQADQYAYAQGTMLVEDIRETSGYTNDTTVVFLGDGAPKAFQYATGDYSQIVAVDGTKYTGINLPIIDTYRLTILLRNWIGVDFNCAEKSTVEYYSNLPEVISMPIYPEQGSIVLKDGYLLVKMSEIVIDPAEPEGSS